MLCAEVIALNIVYGLLSLIQIVSGSGSLVALINDSVQYAIALMFVIFFVGFIKSRFMETNDKC